MKLGEFLVDNTGHGVDRLADSLLDRLEDSIPLLTIFILVLGKLDHIPPVILCNSNHRAVVIDVLDLFDES